jgi:hypothetical protein
MVVMPVIFTQTSAGLTAHFAGEALRTNVDVGLRAFTSLNSSNPVVDALGWSGYLSNEPAHAVVHSSSGATTIDFAVP